ncbi:MAG: hypothetical protein N2053_08595 [Chitinispirillaceae bacterium]|nr:hypothetical protein [Chitinispirillaceae bacterium]
MKKVITFVGIYGILLLLSCTLIVEVDETTLRAENDMTNLEVTYTDGSKYNIVSIDLYDVEIGDVYFSEILAGTTTDKKTTNRRGWVSVYIGSALIRYKFLGTIQSFSVEDIDLMETKIVENEDNVVVFDESTAEDFLSYLGKKLGKKLVSIKKDQK